MTVPKATMAMSSDFLGAFARLPSSQQRSVRTLITRFNADSTASGLNYERVQDARDRKLRSLRIDGSYRAIISKPERGNVHTVIFGGTCAGVRGEPVRLHRFSRDEGIAKNR